MSTVKLHELASLWVRHFNDKDLEALLSLYDDDASHFSPKLRARKPETGGLVRGKVELRAWWADAFERLPTLHYELQEITIEDGRIFIQYLRRVEGETDMDVAEFFRVKNFKICASRVYHG